MVGKASSVILGVANGNESLPRGVNALHFYLTKLTYFQDTQEKVHGMFSSSSLSSINFVPCFLGER